MQAASRPESGVDDSIRLYFQDFGLKTAKPVILIHGWPLDGSMWEYQIPALLDNGFRVITYDRRGFGKSSRPFTGYDYDTLAKDLHTIIESLELQNVALVGFSMGAGEVARYLGRYGAGKLSHAAIIAGVTPYMLKTEDNPSGVPMEIFNEIGMSINSDRQNFMAQFAKGFYGVGLLSQPVSDEILQNHWRLAMQADANATKECAKSFGTTDFRTDMQAFTIPTLIIHGTSDETVPIDASARNAAALVPHARYIEYEGEPHGLHLTATQRLNDDLVAFLKS